MADNRLGAQLGDDAGASTSAWALIATVAMLAGFVGGFAAVRLDLVGANGNGSSSATPAAAASAALPGCDTTTTLRVAAAPDIAPAVSTLAERASGLEESLACVNVVVTDTNVPTTSAALSRGWVESNDGPPPHVWIPTSSTAADLVRAQIGTLLPETATSTAISPSVIAMPEPMAEVLGWPDGDLGWNGVAKLAAADAAWAERDHAEWGPFRLGLVADVADEPSLSAVTALTGAIGALPAGDRSEQPSAAAFEARAQLLLLERKVGYLGATTPEQLQELRAADERGDLLTTVSALPLTEQQVWAYNGGGGDQRPDTPLVAWYPSDGAADADYPYVVLDADWASQRTGIAAGAFLDLLQSDEGVTALRDAGFRDASRQATPQLTDQSQIRAATATPAPPIPPTALVAGVRRAWQGLSQEGNILTLFDVSGSMQTEVPGTGASRLELSIGGAVAGVQLYDPNTNSGLWEFSTDLDGEGTDYRELVPLGPLGEEVGGTDRRSATVAALQALEPRADTGLHDSVAAAYEYMLDHYEPGRINAVLVFTDGANDDPDGLTLDQLQDRLRQLVDPDRRIQVFAVGYGPEADFDALNAITAVTDGKVFELARPEDIRDVFLDVQTSGG